MFWIPVDSEVAMLRIGSRWWVSWVEWWAGGSAKLWMSSRSRRRAKPRSSATIDRWLGRMSLTEAFERLVELEPRLREQVRQGSDELGPKRSGWSIRSEERLVGAWADSPHPVLNTDLAANIVSEYQVVTSNGRTADTDPTPFFERKKGTLRGSFAPFGKGDTRPRAKN
jgi:hypothetical protein